MWKAGNNLFFQCIHICICGCHCSACALCFLPFSLYFIPLFPVLLSGYTQVLALCFYVVFLLLCASGPYKSCLSDCSPTFVGLTPLLIVLLLLLTCSSFFSPWLHFPAAITKCCMVNLTTVFSPWPHLTIIFTFLQKKLTNGQNWEMKLM